MASNSKEIVFDHFPLFRVFKDGHVDRSCHEVIFVQPSADPLNDEVLSKDIIISKENNISARLYLPNNHHDSNKKLPLLIYFHGGGFCVESASSSFYHSYLNKLVAEANVVAVSVDYRLAPEHPVTTCYEDSWSAFEWVVSNAEKNHGSDSEPWLRDHADFSRIFLAGDSAGANIAHNLMAKASDDEDSLLFETKVKVIGMALIHPYFGNGERKANKLWDFICKDGNSSLDDPRFNPAVHPKLLEKLVCTKILICVAEKDFLRERGVSYYEAIKNSAWNGELDIFDTEGEEHVFHLKNAGCDNAIILLKKVATFMNMI